MPPRGPKAVNDAKYERIKIERVGRIMTLTLSNPAKMNAVDGRMHRELADIFYDIQEDESVDVVVLTGEGKAFCAGGDIDWMKRSNIGAKKMCCAIWYAPCERIAPTLSFRAFTASHATDTAIIRQREC